MKEDGCLGLDEEQKCVRGWPAWGRKSEPRYFRDWMLRRLVEERKGGIRRGGGSLDVLYNKWLYPQPTVDWKQSQVVNQPHHIHGLVRVSLEVLHTMYVAPTAHEPSIPCCEISWSQSTIMH